MATEIATTESRDTLETGVFDFRNALAQLRQMPFGLGKAETAGNFISEAQRYIKLFETEGTPQWRHRQKKKEADRVHKYLSELEQRALAPVESLVKYARTIQSQWTIAEDARVKAQRLADEKASIKAQEEALVSEALALEAQGRKAEAAAKLTEPVTPIITEVEKVKLEGVSEVAVWVPEADDDQNVVFEDRAAFRAFFAWAGSMIPDCLDVKYGELKRYLTRNSGLVSPPGIKVLKKYEPRNRG